MLKSLLPSRRMIGREFCRRRVWPAVLMAAPLAATAAYGDQPPLPVKRLPTANYSVKASPTRGYLPLARWQAAQSGAQYRAPERPAQPLPKVVRTPAMPTLAPARGAEAAEFRPAQPPAASRPVVVPASQRLRDAAELQNGGPEFGAAQQEEADSGLPRMPGGRLPGSRTQAETVAAPSALAAPADVYEIDLPTTLRLLLSANPTMAEAREEVREMLALQTRARVIMLPSLNAGTALHRHSGSLQASTGVMRNIYTDSLYAGGGTRVWAAESLAIPMIRIMGHVGDAIYEPLVVRQHVSNKRYSSAAAANTLLLQAIVRYFELLGAEGRYEAARQTEREAAEVVRITASYAITGQGREGDANRARTEAYLLHAEVQRAEERIAVASAKLCELLSLDPSIRLRTIGGPIGGIQLVDPSLDLRTLIQMAERRRPELAAATATVAANTLRVRQERTRPLLPLIMVGYSAGSFGAGSVLYQPLLGNFGGRSDFDAMALWSLNNMGVGNRATVSERRAMLNQSVAERTRALNGVRQEVVAAYGIMQGERLQIRITQRQLKDTQEGFREEFARLLGAEALPIEVLNSVDQLGMARQEVIKAVNAFNEAQFRLFVAAGASTRQIVADATAQAPSAGRDAAPAK
ncbi:MAG TPA: TolC family protein [Pirellulales bacterium]|nr:TolC family protein [Pirellulales bacterium]